MGVVVELSAGLQEDSAQVAGLRVAIGERECDVWGLMSGPQWGNKSRSIGGETVVNSVWRFLQRWGRQPCS